MTVVGIASSRKSDTCVNFVVNDERAEATFAKFAG
jgi:hypothetical protein